MLIFIGLVIVAAAIINHTEAEKEAREDMQYEKDHSGQLRPGSVAGRKRLLEIALELKELKRENDERNRTRNSQKN